MKTESYRAKRRRRSMCFHHNHHTGESYIHETLEYMMNNKVWFCANCAKIWFAR